MYKTLIAKLTGATEIRVTERSLMLTDDPLCSSITTGMIIITYASVTTPRII